MTNHRDWVDRALDTLRSTPWAAETPNPFLEERLMQEFDRIQPTRTARKRRAAPVVVAGVAVAGIAVAAAAYQAVRLFTVNVEGQPVAVELVPVGENEYEGTAVAELPDGRVADVHVQHAEPTANQRRTEVRVAMSGQRSDVYSPAALGDAQPIFKWTTDAGLDRALYLIEDEASGLLRVFTTRMDGESEPAVRLLATLPAEGFEGEPKVSIGEDGGITLVWDASDEGRKNHRVIKLKE